MSPLLEDILPVLDRPRCEGDRSVRVIHVTHDSRKVEPGGLFVAVRGEVSDGHRYIPNAVEKGAVAILAQRDRGPDDPLVPWITVSDTKRALGPVAATVYDDPTEDLVLVGVTGTNGKTTLTYLLERIIQAAGGVPGVIGTINRRWRETERSAPHTTPESSDIQAIFREMVDAGVTHACIETSSHGLHRGRLHGCRFDSAVFTNLSRDHLDYHGDLEEYYRAKRILFTEILPQSGKDPVAVINADDPYGRRLADEISGVPTLRFGLADECDVRPKDARMSAEGLSATIESRSGRFELRSRLTGTFNLMNILAAVAVGEALGIDINAIKDGIEAVNVVPGRLERVPSHRGTVFVDYAHTPQALEGVLEAIGRLKTGRVITVMGCGGDRDTTKRPIMGKEAADGSDFVVITSDNPRSEDPEAIIEQIKEGVLEYGFEEQTPSMNGGPLTAGRFRIIPDRREAIAWALNRLEPEDILLVAGKGHETYQEVDGVRHPFDDREVVREESAKLSDKETGTNSESPV